MKLQVKELGGEATSGGEVLLHSCSCVLSLPREKLVETFVITTAMSGIFCFVLIF